MGPLISAAQRETVQFLRPRGAGCVPRAVLRRTPGSGTRRRCSHRPTRPIASCTRRSSARSSRWSPFDDEADAIRIANDSRVRAVRLDLDPRRRPGDPGEPGHRVGQPVGELALLGAVLDAVRRVQVLRPRARTRAGRPARVHRDQERLHLDIRRGVAMTAARRMGGDGLGRQGRRDHGRRRRHRPRDRAAIRRRGRQGRLRRRRRRRRAAGGGRGRRVVRQVRRHRRGRGAGDVPARRGRATAGWTSRSTTPASRRRTTTRS